MKRIGSNTSLMGLALGLALVAAGCGQSDMLAPGHGRVRFDLSSGASALASGGAAATAMPDPGTGTVDNTQPLLDGEMDAPHRFFQSASVDMTDILARNSDGVMVKVNMDLPVTVDIISVENGKHVTLPDGDLPSGTYDALVLNLKGFQGTTWDGTQITIVPPGAGRDQAA